MTLDKISSTFGYIIIIVIIFVSNSNVEATNSCLEEWLKKLSTQLKVGRSSEPVVSLICSVARNFFLKNTNVEPK